MPCRRHRRGHGLLYGLYDRRFETLALMAHIAHLEERRGRLSYHQRAAHRTGHRVGFGLPAAVRLGRSGFFSSLSPYALAVPYTGIIMSTRENPAIRQRTLNSAFPDWQGRTNPGGYQNPASSRRHTPSLAITAPRGSDCRSDSTNSFSFCTGCYRLSVPAKISRTWRNRASSRKCAPTLCPPLRSIFSTTAHRGKRGK